MEESITWVGIDAHKKNLQFAVVCSGQWSEWQIPNESKAVRRVARKLVKEAPGEVRCCYEAGPLGYSLKRQMETAAPELVCEVVAPSLIPVKAGDRVKTDRRDARKLAKYLQGGLLTEVRPPSEQQEAARDLTRCRRALRGDLMRARHRVSKWLMRRGVHYSPGQRQWTSMHQRWLHSLLFEDGVEQFTFDQYLFAIEQLLEQVSRLDSRLEELAQSESYKAPVGWLRCFRGIDVVAAMTLITEVHDFRRFDSPRQLMSYLGLTPSEYSSGESKSQGAITKAGNTHARRVLVEVSWHYRHRANIGLPLRKRREGQPAWAISIADKAQARLCRRYQRLVARGKPSQKVVIAIARELVGFLWAVMREGEQRAPAH
jgi:transposase